MGVAERCTERMKKKQHLLIGAPLLVTGIALAVLGYVTLKQFSLCCQVSPMPTEAQVQAEFAVFAAVARLTSFDPFEITTTHDSKALVMSALRRFYPCFLFGLILAATGLSLCLSLLLNRKVSRVLWWTSAAMIAFILLEGAWVCILGPHGGRIRSDEKGAHRMHRTPQ